jgi:hypothetical protein
MVRLVDSTHTALANASHELVGTAHHLADQTVRFRFSKHEEVPEALAGIAPKPPENRISKA